MNLYPLNRLVCAEAFANGFEIRRVGIEHGMAIHTGFRGWNAGNGGRLDGSMTVAAVEPVIANVVLVAELHRLRARNILVRGIRRACQPQNAEKAQSSQKGSRKQAES